MTTQVQADETGFDFLTRVLQADGLFCVTTGAIAAFGAGAWAALFGLERPIIFVAIGGVVLVYGLALLLVANGTNQTRLLTQIALGLNIVWVVASFAGLLAGLFPVSTAGKWVIAILADMVLVIAIVQAYGLRR
jgi:hypothetical protein